ncbi:MAG: electron transfer flavoprotein subunit alpha/FixB family protein [Candidatus Thermoplasmatota archaeon]|nr:electron transfer flavoprotein subunit alpha/FixB family protein [Candidatus Thermoplasmatota archaeon]MBU1940205.1 electron transfer flavoprotein subunit alpha/FixB family protein [Candidatus Thermoplasmatota archaeon]
MVLVYSDNKNVFFELLHGAHDLAKHFKTPIVAATIQNTISADDLISHGADTVITITTDKTQFKVEEYATYLKQIIEKHKTQTILIGSTKNGKELASRLAALLNTGCIIDATNITITNNTLQANRIAYSGNAITTMQFTQPPYVLTIPPKYYTALKPDTSRKGEKTTFKPQEIMIPSKITEVKTLKSEGVNVEDAKIIVSCGRGFKNKADIKLIQDLADVLKGRTIGCSRPIAADLKWLSEDHWIGLSGHKVKPKLYIAVGISGQIQHIAGMRDSDIIVAVNKDPEALIFNSADYGIVGDLYEVLPKLTNAIKEKMG